MTDLQLGLLVIGALAVGAVLVYNRLQERSARRAAQRSFGSQHSDVLLEPGEPRREPVVERREPTLQTDAPLAPRPEPAPTLREASGLVRPEPDSLPDPRLDYVVELAAPAGTSAAAALEHWRSLEHRFAKRALLAGRAADGSWRRILAGDHASYHQLRAALQLVSRNGVVGDAEVLEFRAEIETFATRLAVAASAPDMRQSLAAAAELDRFCAEADIQVALHVTGIAPDEAALGTLQGQPFQVERRQDGLTLVLDVPRTADPGRGYEAMVRAARNLANSLGGAVVDDNGRPLDDRSLAAIGAELEPVRRALFERGLEPGGPQALRVFS